MKFALFEPSNTDNVVKLFTTVFAASEGQKEGQSIGNLVSRLIAKTEPADLIGFTAKDSELIVGCIFFSKFVVPDNQTAFILSPVAISTTFQGKGIGQQLITYGLDHLKKLDVDLVFTYGDPAFYSKTGFREISEDIVKAPFVLSQPEGWLAQSLDGSAIKAMPGNTSCVEALSEQKYW